MSASTVVYDATPDEKRNRVTVFFRIILVIPHIVTLLVYGIGVFFAVIAAWFSLVITGRYPQGLYDFVAGASRYLARVNAYMYVLVDPYPPFDLGEHPEYPVRLNVPPPLESYNRVTVFFRIILMIPVFVIQYVLSIVSQLFSIFTWIVAVIIGRTPEGLAGVQVFCMGYAARSTAYFALLTEDWPGFSQQDIPPGPGAAPAPAAAPAGFDAPAPPPPPPPPPSPGPNPFGE